VTVIKSTNGNIFGGFTGKAWDSASGYVIDPKAFIFSLVNKENKPFKVMCTNDTSAINCGSTYGPIFGNSTGCDLLITSGSNTNQTSYCNFGNSYKHPEYQLGTEKAKSILAGSLHFQTSEIEVFSIKD